MKNNPKDVVFNRKDTINIVCELGEIGLWIANLESRGFEVYLIEKIDPVHQIGDDKWNIVASRKELIDDVWVMEKRTGGEK